MFVNIIILAINIILIIIVTMNINLHLGWRSQAHGPDVIITLYLIIMIITQSFILGGVHLVLFQLNAQGPWSLQLINGFKLIESIQMILQFVDQKENSKGKEGRMRKRKLYTAGIMVGW